MQATPCLCRAKKWPLGRVNASRSSVLHLDDCIHRLQRLPRTFTAARPGRFTQIHKPRLGTVQIEYHAQPWAFADSAKSPRRQSLHGPGSRKRAIAPASWGECMLDDDFAHASLERSERRYLCNQSTLELILYRSGPSGTGRGSDRMNTDVTSDTRPLVRPQQTK